MIVTTPVPSYYGFYQKANTNNKIIKIKYSQKKVRIILRSSLDVINVTIGILLNWQYNVKMYIIYRNVTET